MIDTIKLNLYDAIVKSNNDLIIKKENYNDRDSSFDLFVDEKGTIKQGNNAYINNAYFNLTILPKFNIEKFREYKIKIMKSDFIFDKKSEYVFERDILKEYLSINFKDNKNCNFILQTSLSKLYSLLKKDHSKNINYLNQNQIKQTFKFLFLKLKESGIIADLDNANLIRLDLFINIKTEYGYQAYKNILREFSLSRKKMTEKENSFLYANKQNQLSIYDKKEELKLYNINIDSELMRFENRFLTKNKINEKFFGNITEKLLNSNNHLNQLKNNYKDIFKNDIKEKLIDKNFESILNSSVTANEFMKSISLYYLENNFDKEFLYNRFNSKFNSKTSYRLRKLLDTTFFNQMKKENISLFSELKSKYENEINMLETKLL